MTITISDGTIVKSELTGIWGVICNAQLFYPFNFQALGRLEEHFNFVAELITTQRRGDYSFSMLRVRDVQVEPDKKNDYSVVDYQLQL